MNPPQKAPDVFRGHADVLLWIDASPLQLKSGSLSALGAGADGLAAPESLHLTVPENLREQFGGSHGILATWTSTDEHDWSLQPGGRLCQWLLDYFRQRVLNLAPKDQPKQVHELTAVLFRCFRLEQGGLQLGGCTMEDRPILCRTCTDAGGSWTRKFYHPDLVELEGEQIRSLGLEQLEPYAIRARGMSVQEVDQWGDQVEEHFAQLAEGQNKDAARDGQNEQGGQDGRTGRVAQESRVMQSVVWCKYAKGELTARGETDHVRLPFEGWAAEILHGTVKPPPYKEPATGDESHELVRLDDGRLTANTAVAVCEASNKRVLRTQLQKCPATGTFALEEFFSTCPVTGDQVFSEGMRPCAQCRQLVGTHSLNAEHICSACYDMKSAGPEDPRLARILGEHPGLSVWRRWRLSETADVYILSAAALLRKLLIVLDKETLTPRHVAVRSRFSKVWATPSDLEQQELLSGR